MPIFLKRPAVTKTRAAIAVVIVGGIAAVAVASTRKAPEAAPSRFRTVVADVGAITQTVTATGTINPVALVNVGSQVSGTVVELNADFNDRVKKGQVLLKLDPTIFNAQIRQVEATLASAQASMRLAQANYDRNERLVAEKFVSSVTLDQSRRELDVAKATVKATEAQLARAQADLDNSIIRAPIDGIIIKRTIDLGQTVAASFTTPNLFQIARDLTRMQIDTSVSEADVGALKDGQSATFIVDAYPDREFSARMRQFRLAANVVQNVVTYNVVLDVDNTDELLKPGMTAQVRIITGKRTDVLRIPTAALRFRLSDEEQEKEQKAKAEKAGKAGAQIAAAPADDDASFRSKGETGRVFKIYKRNDKGDPVPVDIHIGLSNFRFTEVQSGDLKKGDNVITRASKNADESQ